MKKVLLTALAILIISSPLYFPTASAQGAGYSDTPTNQNNSDPFLGIGEKLSDIEATTTLKDATISITDSEGTRLLTTNEEVNVYSFLKSYDLNPDLYRTSNNLTLEESLILESGQFIALFKQEVKGTSEQIIIPSPIEKHDDSTLFKGEEKIVTQGVDGVAIKTTLYTKNSTNSELEENITENLIIMTQPTVTVINVGTKDLPAVSSAPKNIPATATGYNYSSSSSFANVALSKVGSSYVSGGAGPNSFDCSGLVQWAFAQTGVSVSRTATTQGKNGTPVSWDNIQPGDLVWNYGHIAIYIGDGLVVHAANPARGVVVDPVSWYQKGYSVSRY